jgi:putative acetyltransferase
MTMKVTIRPETQADRGAIREVCGQAFGRESEGLLVERLRALKAFAPTLSLVADVGGRVVGYVLLFPVKVRMENAEYLGLSLGPIAVVPAYQCQGIGGQLIEAAHQAGRILGYRFVVVLGHPSYYPRFGYKLAALWQLTNPWGIHNEAYMALELVKGGLSGVSGMVDYPSPFNDAV